MSEAVPVRFTRETIAAVKQFAAQDGLSVSAWVRRLVQAEMDAREPQEDPRVAAAVKLIRSMSDDDLRPGFRRQLLAILDRQEGTEGQ